MRLQILIAVGGLASACSDDATSDVDAAIDAQGDGPIDAAPGACGQDRTLTGEYLDWDSSTSSLMGLYGATWTVRGDVTRTDESNFNGRVSLCIAPGTISILDAIDTANPADYVEGVFVADPAVFDSSSTFFTAKNFTVTRRDEFYQQTIGSAFATDRGHLLVQKLGTPMPLSSSRGGTTVAVDNSDDLTWEIGNTGGLVLFANIDLAAGSQTTLSSTASFVGPTALTLEPGKLVITTIR